MRLATYNLENLFRRPVVMNQESWADGRRALSDYEHFGSIVAKATYSASDKRWLADFLVEYELAARRSSGDAPFQLNEVRGKLFKLPRGQQRPEIIVDGRAEWDGWLELRKQDVNHIAIENTARVVAAVAADVLAVVEVEDRIALQRFNDLQLTRHGAAYPFNMLIDGNDSRGIDVGIYSRREVASIRSNVAAGLPGTPIFSRDCAEYEISLAGGSSLWVLVNHFKSKGYGSQASSAQRRQRQAAEVKRIYQQRHAQHPLVAVVGDLNDIPTSPALSPLLQQTDLRDVMSHPNYVNGSDRRPGTYASGSASNKLDYILLSPALWSRVQAVAVERRGVWAPRTFPHFPEVTEAIEAASDHAAVCVDLDV